MEKSGETTEMNRAVYYQCLECEAYFDEEMAWFHAEPGMSKCARGVLFPKPRIIEMRSGKYGVLK